jgi:hypothetical protein
VGVFLTATCEYRDLSHDYIGRGTRVEPGWMSFRYSAALELSAMRGWLFVGFDTTLSDD